MRVMKLNHTISVENSASLFKLICYFNVLSLIFDKFWKSNLPFMTIRKYFLKVGNLSVLTNSEDATDLFQCPSWFQILCLWCNVSCGQRYATKLHRCHVHTHIKVLRFTIGWRYLHVHVLHCHKTLILSVKSDGSRLHLKFDLERFKWQR